MTFLSRVLLALLGRDLTWRLSRQLYAAARGEKRVNAIAVNGESRLIERVLADQPEAGTALCFDIGANLGEWSDVALAAASECGRSIALHLFEAAPVAAQLLRDRFASKGNVQVHECAMSDHEGVAHFALSTPTGGTNSLEVTSLPPGTELVEVRLSTGAGFAAAAGLSNIALIKIDTEGHDFSVLAGFVPLLKEQQVGVVQFEYNSRWLSARRSLFDVFALAEPLGYRVGRVCPDGVELFERWNPECDRFIEDNYALISPALSGRPWCRETRWSVSNTLIMTG